MSTLIVGPRHGSLQLFTSVEGPAATWGHELTLHVTDWQCSTELSDGLPVAVRLEGHLPSLAVVAGQGGIMPLTDKQRSKIRQSALTTLSADRSPTFTYDSAVIQQSPDGWHVEGELSLGGARHPVPVEVTLGNLPRAVRIVARSVVEQSHFGIRPYTGMLGALKIMNRVRVVVDVCVPDPR